jgi:hypothetical protein
MIIVSFLNFIEQNKILKMKGFPLKNTPRSPLSKGGSIIFIYGVIECGVRSPGTWQNADV